MHVKSTRGASARAMEPTRGGDKAIVQWSTASKVPTPPEAPPAGSQVTPRAGVAAAAGKGPLTLTFAPGGAEGGAGPGARPGAP